MKSGEVTLNRIASQEALMAAWKKVRANRGAAGLDGVTIERFEEDLERNLGTVSELLRDGEYLPMPPRRTLIPKSTGKIRALGIPSVEDRIVQRATLDALEPVCEDLFLDCNFGYRPRRSIRDAAKAVLGHRAAGSVWVVDADIEDFFGSLEHRHMLRMLGEIISDSRVFELLEMWLGIGKPSKKDMIVRSGALELFRSWHRMRKAVRDQVETIRSHLPDMPEDTGIQAAVEDLVYRLAEEALRGMVNSDKAKRQSDLLRKVLGGCGAAMLTWSVLPVFLRLLNRGDTEVGILQGAPISPLLANLYLHRFDEAMAARGHRLVRYADDFVVLFGSREEAEAALTDVELELDALGLRLNREKTGIVNFDDGFEFLGYTFRGDRAQMGDDARTCIRAARLREVLYGMRRTVRNVPRSPVLRNLRGHRMSRLVQAGRRLFRNAGGDMARLEREEIHGDALR